MSSWAKRIAKQKAKQMPMAKVPCPFCKEMNLVPIRMPISKTHVYKGACGKCKQAFATVTELFIYSCSPDHKRLTAQEVVSGIGTGSPGGSIEGAPEGVSGNAERLDPSP